MRTIKRHSDTLRVFRELRARFKLWRKHKKDCHHCCLFCDFFEDCEAEINGNKTVEHRGYTIKQSELNYHTTIYEDNGRMVMHTQTTKPLTVTELREQIDFYLDILTSGSFEKSLEEGAE